MRACFIFLLCMLMTSASKFLEKKNFPLGWNVKTIGLCVHWDMKHLGSLGSTQEARVALSYASSDSYASFVLSKLLVCFISQWTHADIWTNCWVIYGRVLLTVWKHWIDWVQTVWLFLFFIMAGKKVWDEVAEHSKEFIQEYLEEFPNVRDNCLLLNQFIITICFRYIRYNL